MAATRWGDSKVCLVGDRGPDKVRQASGGKCPLVCLLSSFRSVVISTASFVELGETLEATTIPPEVGSFLLTVRLL